MVPPASHRVSRVPWYSGSRRGVGAAFAYGAITLCRQAFQPVRLPVRFVTPWPFRRGHADPTTPHAENTLRGCATRGLGSVPVRSPLLGESQLLSFPSGTEMVHFPEFASVTYVFRDGW